MEKGAPLRLIAQPGSQQGSETRRWQWGEGHSPPGRASGSTPGEAAASGAPTQVHSLDFDPHHVWAEAQVLLSHSPCVDLQVFFSLAR